MLSSVFPCIRTAKNFLLLSGIILKQGGKCSSPGWFYPRDSKIAQQYSKTSLQRSWMTEEDKNQEGLFFSDILITAKMQAHSIQLTVSLLNLLGLNEYSLQRESTGNQENSSLPGARNLWTLMTQWRTKRSHLPSSRAPHCERDASLHGNGRLVSLMDTKLWATRKTSVWSP